MSYEIVRTEQIDEYGHNAKSVMESMEDKEEAMKVCDEYNENETNYHVHYIVRIVRP